jgi:hypothetical protein
MPNPEYEAAIRTLEQAALGELSGFVSNYRLRRGLVEKAIGVKIEVAPLARLCGVSERTAASHWKIIREWIGGRPKGKAKSSERARISAGAGTADVAINCADAVDVETASDGIASLARKRADELLSSLPFIGQ